LDALGLGDADLGRHIACDIGVRRLGAVLAERLDAASSTSLIRGIAAI
jgi:predicted N-formylglutamate amidohydrolase